MGFVFIMGNFYVGYFLLIWFVWMCVDWVVVSVFVNFI